MALIKIQSYSLLGAIQDNKTVLGGSAGSGGGTGDPPAGFVGQLTQSNVTFDTAGSSRACSAGSAGSSSLVDNLDAIRLGLEICDDAIGDRHIDWGHGAEQVDAEDVPVSSGSFTATNVHDALEEVLGEGGGGLPANAQGSIVRGGVADWEAHVAKTDHFILVGDGADIVSKAFDWDDMAAGAGADMVHNHSTAGEGGTHWGGITQAFGGGSGANTITIPDGLAEGLIIRDGDPIEYLMIDTSPQLVIDFNRGGADIDIYLRSVGVDAVFIQGSDGAISLGGPSMGVVDGWWLGGGAAAGRLVFEFDTAPDQIQIEDADLNMRGNDILIPDNVADALHFVDVGDTADYLTFVTTDGSREVVVNQDDHPNIDFRVGAAGRANALVVQGSSGFVGINMVPTVAFEINASVAVAGVSQFRVNDGATGGYFAVVEGTSNVGAYVPVFQLLSAGLAGYGGFFSGMIPPAMDTVAQPLGGALTFDGRRDGGAVLTTSNVIVFRNYTTHIMTMAASGFSKFGSSGAPATLVELEATETLGGNVADDYAACLTLDPGYTGAFTVDRHNYIDVQNVSLAGGAAVTDAAVMRFDAAIGTHKCLPAAFQTTDSGADTTNWAGGLLININGTLYKIPYIAA